MPGHDGQGQRWVGHGTNPSPTTQTGSVVISGGRQRVISGEIRLVG